MNQEAARLLQAIQHFQERSKGAEMPEGLTEAAEALAKALQAPPPGSDTPGSREALKASHGATGEHFAKAAIGADKPTPGQIAARGQSDELSKAAEQILASAKS